MSPTSDPQTIALRESKSSLDSFVQQESLSLPPIQGLPESLLAEPNRGQDIGTQTQTLDQGGRFTINGGSAQFTLSGFQQVLPLLRQRPSKERFNAMQKWEGFVIEVKDETFFARLTPIVGEGPDQEAEIYLSEIEPEDRSLVEPGAVFYWSIGYLDRPSGRLRASIIRFRRLPAWTKQELETARAEVTKLKNLLHGKRSA